ncbi:hypothetical protein OOZ51_02585 [Arthrobacter sp. MI7-26]|uniref:hypothetical protein n=1 Tax=Arthrobacter sp. MI7-26 TaxID=2993653 RepID=UPI0022489AF0|nr:hypothetical protein [Arthrobacter sp. MI7-26]MCX2746699.1 hypothetical protein [Arthrobacter sp. MI7-26]
MGATNVAKVFTLWRHLSHRDARLLLYMANTSLDTEQGGVDEKGKPTLKPSRPPRYFGGWEDAAEAIGLDPRGKKDSAKETFRQAVANLVKAGAVVSSGNARIGTRAEYALALDRDETFQPEIVDSHDPDKRPVIRWHPIKRAKKTLPLVGQENIGDRGKKTLPPRSTSGTTTGIQEEPLSPQASKSPANEWSTW